MMRIIFLECKKALLSPIILVLLIVFAAWNVFIIYDAAEFKADLDIVNEFAGKYGVRYSDETLEKINESIKPALADLNDITEQKEGHTFQRAIAFFEELDFTDQGRYTENELQSFYKLSLKESLVDTAANMDDRYAAFDVKGIGESEISKYGLTGAAADTLRKEYRDFSKRFDQLQENGEHEQWFFPGKPYQMHKFLFGTVFRHIILEVVILVVLVTALITNYEFENRTQLVTYTTKRGRRLTRDKLLASLLVTTVITAVICSMTLAAYFIIFDYSFLWNTAISSGFNWEYNFPNVAWFNWSFMTYLLMGIVLIYVCMLLFSVFTFILSIFTKNSYLTFILFAMIFIILFLVQEFLPGSTILMLASGFNLSSLVLNSQQWWMGSGGLSMFQHYEWVTIVVWSIIYGGLCAYSMKRFAKQDIS